MGEAPADIKLNVENASPEPQHLTEELGME
jgi:hypothetical protein